MKDMQIISTGPVYRLKQSYLIKHPLSMIFMLCMLICNMSPSSSVSSRDAQCKSLKQPTSMGSMENMGASTFHLDLRHSEIVLLLMNLSACLISSSNFTKQTLQGRDEPSVWKEPPTTFS
jgi:hypothetical protein